MGQAQKILTVTLWGVLVLVMVAVIGAGAWDRWRKPAEELPILYDAPPFALTDQDAKPFTDKQLAGHVWVADFIYTHCAGPCPLMTAEMAKLQKAIGDPGIRFTSFSVDPIHDTPGVLKDYAATFGAKEPRWTFLTSANPADIYTVANGMKLSAVPADAENPPIHAQQFLLIDPDRRVRGIYHIQDPDSMRKLARDAQSLAEESLTGKAR